MNEEIRALFERFGVSKSRLRIVAPYSDDPRVGDEADVSLPTVIEDFIASHAPVLATVGGLEPEYDVPIQLAMLSSLRETRPDAGLVIVGDGSIRKQIESAIAETGLSEHALLCGDTPHAITLEIIRRADVLLRTSKYDGDSIAVREAIALGTPVVATDNGMRPAGVRLFPTSDLDALRQVVSEALTSGPTSVRIGEHNGIDAVIELYHELVR